MTMMRTLRPVVCILSLLDKFRALESSFWAKISLFSCKEFKDKWILYMQDRIVGVFDNKEKAILFLRRLKKESCNVLSEAALCVKMGSVPKFYRILLKTIDDEGNPPFME